MSSSGDCDGAGFAYLSQGLDRRSGWHPTTAVRVPNGQQTLAAFRYPVISSNAEQYGPHCQAQQTTNCECDSQYVEEPVPSHAASASSVNCKRRTQVGKALMRAGAMSLWGYARALLLTARHTRGNWGRASVRRAEVQMALLKASSLPFPVWNRLCCVEDLSASLQGYDVRDGSGISQNRI